MNARGQIIDVVDWSRERNRLLQWDVQKLLESQVSNLAVAAALNHERPLVVTSHLSPQELELGNVSDGLVELNLPENVFSLRERRIGDRNEPVSESGVVVRLRHVENVLRALRSQLDIRGASPGGSSFILRGDSSASEDIL